MTKVFYDIIPPQKVHRGKDTKAERSKSKKKHGKLPWLVFLVSLAIVVLGGFIYQIEFKSFSLSVWPKTQIISLEKEIIVQVGSASLEQPNAISGQVLTDRQELSKQFPATGQKVEGQLARGTIRVFNTYQPAQSITLRAKTRFLSSTGKYFRAPEKIHLSPAHWEKGKLVPSWTDVKVVAMEEGPDYNIKPDHFSIPGLAGTAYYNKVYGQSSEAMQGGEIKTIAQVSEEDLQKAQESLRQELFKLSQESLKKKVGPDMVFLPTVLSQEIEKKDSSIKVGEEVPQFDYNMTVVSRTIVFPRSEVKQLIMQAIQQQLTPGKAVVDGSFMLNYVPLAVNFDQKMIDCNVKATAKVYSSFDEEELKKMIAGKNLSVIPTLMKNEFPQFAEVRGEITPFWLRHIPVAISKIHIKTYLNH